MNRTNKGFSLVELMIVVAIIGVLTAIAIPNFQIFQARSRQAEAKSVLTGIYTSAKAFHARWEAFATPFESIGYDPAGELRYAAGWDADLASVTKIGGAGLVLHTMTNCDGTKKLGSGPAPGRLYKGKCAANSKDNNTENYCETTAGPNCTYVGVDGVDILLNDSTGITTAIGVNTFLAGAVTDLSGNETTAATVKTKGDVWSIDQAKNLVNVRDQVDTF